MYDVHESGVRWRQVSLDSFVHVERVGRVKARYSANLNKKTDNRESSLDKISNLEKIYHNLSPFEVLRPFPWTRRPLRPSWTRSRVTLAALSRCSAPAISPFRRHENQPFGCFLPPLRTTAWRTNAPTLPGWRCTFRAWGKLELSSGKKNFFLDYDSLDRKISFIGYEVI